LSVHSAGNFFTRPQPIPCADPNYRRTT